MIMVGCRGLEDVSKSKVGWFLAAASWAKVLGGVGTT